MRNSKCKTPSETPKKPSNSLSAPRTTTRTDRISARRGHREPLLENSSSASDQSRCSTCLPVNPITRIPLRPRILPRPSEAALQLGKVLLGNLQSSAQSRVLLARRLSANRHSRIPRAVPLVNHRSLDKEDQPLVNRRSWGREGRPLDSRHSQLRHLDSLRNQLQRLVRRHSQLRLLARHQPLARNPAPLALHRSGSRRNRMLKAVPLVRPASLARNRILLGPRRIRTITRVPLGLRATTIMLPQRIPLVHLAADLPTTRTRAHLEMPTTNRPTLDSAHSGNLHRELRPLASNRILRQHRVALLLLIKHQPRMRTTLLVNRHNRSLMVSHHRTISKRIHLDSHRNPIPSANPLQHPQARILLLRLSLRPRSQQRWRLLVARTLQTAANNTRRLKATVPRAWMADSRCSVASQSHIRITCQASETLMEHGDESGSQMARRDIQRIRSFPLSSTMTSPRLSGWRLPKRASLRAA